MPVPANENKLNFTDVKYTKVLKWGDYSEKVKWKLSENAKNRGFILQEVKFEYEIRWVANNQKLTPEEVFGAQADWTSYSELWLISAGNNQPAKSLNQDHFIFESIEETYGFMKETGKAYFFESNKTPKELGFAINPDCPAGEFMFSKKGSYDPGPVVKTGSIDHLVHVKWDKEGCAELVKELPSQ